MSSKVLPQSDPPCKRKGIIELEQDPRTGCVVIKVLDPRGFYPFLLDDPEAGTYRVTRTRRGGLQMTR
jgi:hypothetical protein